MFYSRSFHGYMDFRLRDSRFFRYNIRSDLNSLIAKAFVVILLKMRYDLDRLNNYLVSYIIL